MILVEQIQTTEIVTRLSEFDNLGGVIDFKVFKVNNAGSDKEAHCLVAQRTLELLSQDNDDYFNQVANTLDTGREVYFKVGHKSISADIGTAITSEQFFGPYFNFKEQRPILLGTTGKPFQNVTVFSDYYHYDDSESPENIVMINDWNGDFVTQGYTDAFLKPPHPFGRKDMTNYDIGKYFLGFNQFLFDDIKELRIYSWATDCSNYFDDGKEWWGSFFWTVYNSTKDWYVGIAASTTD
ncbi:hypothetical protein BH11BAC3_BH11BAC3_27210 [soil metagenome]